MGVKISGMSAASALTGTEKVEVTQSGATKYTTAQAIADLGGGGGFTQGAKVTNSSNISVSDSTPTILTFDTEAYDTDTIHSTVTDTSRLTCKTAGKYLVIAHIVWTADAAGIRYAALIPNGGTLLGGDAIAVSIGANIGGTWTPSSLISTIVSLAVNDYLEIHVYQDSGNTVPVISAAGARPTFMMARVG